MWGFFFFIKGLILVHFWGLLVSKLGVNCDQSTPPPARVAHLATSQPPTSAPPTSAPLQIRAL
nr:MAG TPA: hypothetical protein [Caudoviricetes sp.]